MEVAWKRDICSLKKFQPRRFTPSIVNISRADKLDEFLSFSKRSEVKKVKKNIETREDILP